MPLEATIAFIHDLTWNDVPEDVRERVRLLQRDIVAVSLAGRETPAARIAADHATEQHPGCAATALVDGRRLSATGAAWANGVLANALDFDDGHRLVKGHPGANVVPAALAVAEAAGATVEEYLTAVVVGYEVALRAGLLLHARSGEYHGSGAWGAVGAAAASARLLRLDADRTGHALGFAEYHAPLAPIMRSVAEPAMTKDACGWGAMLGVSSAHLAARGYTALECTLVGDDVGALWHLRDVYVKPFPCCRWSHPAIQAALELRLEHAFDSESGGGVGYARSRRGGRSRGRGRERRRKRSTHSPGRWRSRWRAAPSAWMMCSSPLSRTRLSRGWQHWSRSRSPPSSRPSFPDAGSRN
ncbi:MAG: MmgE/PrpD family protein [Gaiellaceae bacterium]